MMAVGIDPGHQTGFAVWDSFNKRLTQCKALPIHRALQEVEVLHSAFRELVVIFEDARQRTWYGNADERQRKYGAAIREGVGSVKRDCVIWEEFLTDLGIAHVARKPIAGNSKWPQVQFARATGWTSRTNEHARDAGMLVFGLPINVVQSIGIAHESAREAGQRANATTGT